MLLPFHESTINSIKTNHITQKYHQFMWITKLWPGGSQSKERVSHKDCSLPLPSCEVMDEPTSNVLALGSKHICSDRLVERLRGRHVARDSRLWTSENELGWIPFHVCCVLASNEILICGFDTAIKTWFVCKGSAKNQRRGRSKNKRMADRFKIKIKII